MEENIKNEIVEMAAENLDRAAENLDKAIVETGIKPASVITAQPSSTGKTLAIGVGTFLGGMGLGIALDRWVVPAIGKGIEKVKAKRAAKKAEKALKKAQKAAAKIQENKPAKAPEASTENDGIDPTTIDTTVKD